MSDINSLLQAPLAILIIMKDLVVTAAVLYIFVIYPKPVKTGFYSKSTRRRLMFVLALAFFPFYILFYLVRVPFKTAAKVIEFVDE